MALIPPALSVGIGSLEKELNLELILFLLTLIPPALSSLFFPSLLVYNLPFSFQLFCFSSTFSILLILSLSLLYSFHVVSLSAIARSLTVIVDIGSLEKDINSWVNSVHIGSDTSCSFSWYRIFWEGIKSWVNSVQIVLDTSCSFFPLLPHSACIYFPSSFQLFCFSFTFSILLILSLSLLYSFHVVSLSAIARSLTVIVDKGSLDKNIKSWVNSVHIGSDTSCSFSWYRISWEGIKSWVNSVQIVSDTSCSFFPLLPYSACIDFSFFFSTLLFLLYILHPSDSFPFSSLLFSCSLFKCNCPKFDCNSIYRISWEGH